MSNIATAFRQYADRPADERFPSLDAMIANALHEKNLSAERTYNLKDLRAIAVPGADPNGLQDVHLASPKGSAGLSHWAFGQLSRTVGAPAGYLRNLPAQLAADCINHGLSSSPVGTAANLLVRGANGQPPLIRACTSESYGRVWDAELYSAVASQITKYDDKWTLPPTWSGEPAGAYRGDRDSFLILTNGGSIVTDPSLANAFTTGAATAEGRGPVDGMFRGLLLRNSEVGASSIVIESILYRYVCGNHMLWGAVIDKSFRRRHVGKSAMRETVREIGRIAVNWAGHSAEKDQAIIRNLIRLEIASTKEAVIDELRAMGATAEQATSAYETCEQTEGASPRSFWGIAQGLTRDSQTTAYQDDRYSLDKLAGMVLARGSKVAA